MRDYSGLPEISYPFHDRDILVMTVGASVCTTRTSISPLSWQTKRCVADVSGMDRA